MMDGVFKEAETKMQKSVESLQHEFAKLRTGRANAALLDQVMVSYYGNETPLNQVASVTVPDARTIVVSPWDKGMIQAVEKAIQTADLGLNPATSSDGVRVPMPPMTEERRKELVKIIKKEAEGARISVRNARRDANAQIAKLLKDKSITEDDERVGGDRIQKLTDDFVKKIDVRLGEKEKDVMSV